MKSPLHIFAAKSFDKAPLPSVSPAQLKPTVSPIHTLSDKEKDELRKITELLEQLRYSDNPDA
jgi:hypothetical protein